MTTQTDTDWRDVYRTLTPEQQEQAQKITPPMLPGAAAKTNSFTLLHTFYNEDHDEKGRFTGPGGQGGTETSSVSSKPVKRTVPISDLTPTSAPIANFGFEKWPAARKNEILDQVVALRDKYPVEKIAMLSVNAGGNSRTNVAMELQALAAVDFSIPTHIDINPNLKNQKWLEENDPGTTVSTGNLKDVITHEFGHVVEAALPKRLQTQLQEPFIKAEESLFDLEDGKGDGTLYKALTTKVSEYAGDNVSEGIAEAFLQHEKGIHNEYSDHVGAILDKWKGSKK